MKRLLSFAAAFIAALTTVACSVPTRSTSTRSNGLGSAFTSEVSMTVGRLNAEGTLKRSASARAIPRRPTRGCRSLSRSPHFP